ncbi:mitochondrial carrier domain-containing protein [Geopyxis carbonaria]|nr:mitochondrial carrier domain-containing protein [Geopyxis carbonaria]
MSLGSRITNLISGGVSSDSSNTSSNTSIIDVSTPQNDHTVARYSTGHEAESRPPYHHAMLAGGLGGVTGDMLMHSLDTVKTRQQGAPTALKYSTTPRAYSTILREEGLVRGLYSGVTPAFMGSLPGTIIFFGTYEYSKRHLIDAGCPDSIAYLAGGLLGDLFASFVYVPSEVLKTRLQLQGRHNNPFFSSGYNYRSTLDAARTIVRTEGPQALFHGYKATIMRDLPFSALQFAFYESFQKWAKAWCGHNRDIGLGLEIATGATAGGLAGVITCPLDVVKTRLQTQVQTPRTLAPSPTMVNATATAAQQKRNISTSSPSTQSPPKEGAMKLGTSSVLRGLTLIYKSEGIGGWFRGVGPRAVWTSVQSSVMLVMYQSLLKNFDKLSQAEVEI